MKLVDTKDGNKTLSIDGKFIHSKYSPLKEAEKFISANLKTDTTLVLLGPGLGYTFKVLEETHPNIEIISIPFHKELGDISKELNPTDREQWDVVSNLEDFLRKVIHIENIKGLQILEWNPCSNIYPQISQKINEAIINRIRRINGNILTTARFGKKWLQNSIKNFLKIECYVKEFKLSKPIIIVASGKSLNGSIETIKRVRDSVILISLTSSNCALKYYNIVPDITFSTDPGYYSKLHIYNSNNTIAMPLTNSTSSGSPVLLLNQGNEFEELLISLGNIPNIRVNENGTVAGTALEFALKNSNQPIFLFGQDLASTDIESHIKPYTFDNLLRSEESKVSPYYSIMYRRWIMAGVSFQTYRNWFSNFSSKYPKRVFRVGSLTESIPGVEDISTTNFINSVSGSSKKESLSVDTVVNLTMDSRYDIVDKLLRRWIKEFNEKKIEENSLFYLISTSIYTDVKSKTLSIKEYESLINEGKNESINFLKRLLKLYGRKLL